MNTDDDPIRSLIDTWWPKEGDKKERTLAFHDSNLEALRFYPASTTKHHCYVGGYYDHVLEVMNNTLTLFHLVVLDIGKFDMTDALEGAYWHDADKAVSFEHGKSFRYTLDEEPPTDKQRDYAERLGCVIEEYDSKTSISTKIDAAKEGRPLDPRDIAYFRFKDDYMPVDDGAIVASIAARAGIFFSLPVLSAICTHHGSWAPIVQFSQRSNRPIPLGVLLHAADYMSTACQNGRTLG
jgi:Putative helicase